MGARFLTCQAPTPSIPQSCSESTRQLRVYPILIVASEDDKPVAKLLAAIRKSVRMFPPGIIKRCEVYGTGEYFNNEADKEIIFSDMLQRLTNEALRDSFLIEFRNLEMPCSDTNLSETTNTSPSIGCGYATRCTASKGGRAFQPVTYPANKERAQKRRPSAGSTYQRGDSLFCPDVAPRIFFQDTAPLPQHQVLSASRKPVDKGQQSKIFIVTYKEKIIGGSACIYSDDSAYLWFSGGMRKTYALQYPGILAVWKALDDAKQRGYRHLEFMDVGLPFRKHGYREFVLRFGGKQSSTRRWFRFRWNWLNRVLIKMYE